jgi:hypothetical protein
MFFLHTYESHHVRTVRKKQWYTVQRFTPQYRILRKEQVNFDEEKWRRIITPLRFQTY